MMFCLSLKFAIHKRVEITIHTIGLVEITIDKVHAHKSLGIQFGVIVFHDYIMCEFCAGLR